MAASSGRWREAPSCFDKLSMRARMDLVLSLSKDEGDASAP
jgi:hypothetical protein